MKDHSHINLFGPSFIISLIVAAFLIYIYGPPYYLSYEAERSVRDASLRLLKGDIEKVVVTKVVEEFRTFGVCIGENDVNIQWSNNRQDVDVWITYGVYRSLLLPGKYTLVKFNPSSHSTMNDVRERNWKCRQ